MTILVLGSKSHGQKLIQSGQLETISYEFKGPEQYHLKGDLCHAIAYENNKDVGEVYASISFVVNYQVYKIPGKGFETIINFQEGHPQGQFELYDYDFSKDIFPLLKTAKLYYTNGSSFIYVKEIPLIDSLNQSYSFKFRHQRFATEWELSLKDIEWQERYNDEEFNQQWALVNDYQNTYLWMEHMDQIISSPKNPWEILIYSERWLSVFYQIKQMGFYKELILRNQWDPKSIAKKIDIENFKLESDIKAIKEEDLNDEFDLNATAKTYFNLERDLLALAVASDYLYGDLYFEFNPKNTEHFCLVETHALLKESSMDSAVYLFEHHIQDQSIQLITQLIEEKKANEALFQINRFNQFYQVSQHLNKSATFFQFKAKAVYDIYLSYIQVSRQALEHNQIDMAINYLDKASEIQKQYPSEIINNLQVEKQLQELVKKGMNRYQDLMDQEDFETAKRVKEGILGLMKKLGMVDFELPKNRS